MNEELDENRLAKLVSEIYSYKVHPEFTDEEIKKFNDHVKHRDVNSIVAMFREKENINNEVFKDMIHSKTNSLCQFIVNNSYSLFKPNMLREEFLNNLSDYEKLAVQFGDFNYQVEDGGMIQWYEYGYGNDVDDLIYFLKNSDYSYKDNFIEILEGFVHVKEEIEDLDFDSEWFAEDYGTRIKPLNGYDTTYSNIKDSWNEYFENYLIQNIPNEYVDKIYELDKNISY